MKELVYLLVEIETDHDKRTRAISQIKGVLDNLKLTGVTVTVQKVEDKPPKDIRNFLDTF